MASTLPTVWKLLRQATPRACARATVLSVEPLEETMMASGGNLVRSELTVWARKSPPLWQGMMTVTLERSSSAWYLCLRTRTSINVLRLSMKNIGRKIAKKAMVSVIPRM